MEFAQYFFDRFYKCFLGLAVAVLVCGSPPAFAQSNNTDKQSKPSEGEVASQLLTSLTKAQSRFLADFGRRAFDRMDFPGGKSLGTTWEEYLTSAGYPPSVDEREQVASLLPSLDRQAKTVLVMGLAREEAVEHLVIGLKRIVSGATPPMNSARNPSGLSFTIVFGEDTSIQTTLTAGDHSTYHPRSNDEISWQLTCKREGPPDLKTSVRGCFDNDYGYLIANATKKPLDSEQGRYLFAGTRSTGEPMVYEAPSGYCRPRFLELKARECTLEVRVSRPPQ